MLSWNDDADIFTTKRSPLTKATSLTRPGNSFEAQRTGSSRKSVEVPSPPGSRKSVEVTLSPTGSLNKAHSLLRGPGNAADGTIGSEGWWHHMDHSQMNESPADDSMSKAKTKTTGYAVQNIFVAQKQSLWAEEEPAAAEAPPLPAATLPLKSEEPILKLPEEGVPAAPAAAVPVGSNSGNGGGALQSMEGTGWWTRMDNSPLNQPPETTPPTDGAAVCKGERVMGGCFTPQLDITGGGRRYGSIFADQSVQKQQEQWQQAAEQQPDDTKPLEQQVADWGPFCGQQQSGTTAAGVAFGGGGGAEDDCWTSFASAPKA